MRVKKGVKKLIGKISFVKASVLLMCLSMLMAVFVTIPKVNAEDEVVSKSFYMMSSAAASYYNESQQPTFGGASALGKLHIGDAGGLLSYVDADTPGVVEYISSKISTAATSNTYKSMLNVSTKTGATSSMYFYARYGYLLKSAGLDSTGKEGSPLRLVTGIPLWLIYQLAQSVPLLFVTILDILTALNVFKLFAAGFNRAIVGVEQNGGAIADSGKLMEMDEYGNTITGSAIGGLLQHVSESLTGTYESFYTLGWELTIPFSIVAILAGIFLFRNDSRTRNGKIKNLILRVMMITFGIPICGGLYTAALEEVRTALVDGMNGTSTVVACTLCDFEGWVEKGRLAVPDKVELISKGSSGSLAGELDGESYANLRTVCYRINMLAGIDPLTNSSSVTDTDWDNMALEKTGKQTISPDQTEKIVDLINRYMHGTTYESAAFESSTKAWLTKQSKDSDDYATKADEVIQNSLETGHFYGPDDTNENTSEGDVKTAASERFFRTEDGKETRWDQISTGKATLSANVWNNGGLQVASEKIRIYDANSDAKVVLTPKQAENDKSAITSTIGQIQQPVTTSVPLDVTTNKPIVSKENKTTASEKINTIIKESDLLKKGNKFVYSTSSSSNILAEKDGANINAIGGLSTMAMYNYLNSEFTKSGVTMYSANKSTSLFTKPSHRSVNLIGGGAMGILYWLQAIITLLSVVILGFGYALPILGNSFKISMQIIYNMPFMMLGVIKSGIRVIVYTMALIIEVVGTLFLYSIILDIILALGNMSSTSIENTTKTTILLETCLNTAGGISTLKGTLTFTIIKMIFSMLIIIILTIKALTIRGALVKSINEMMEQALERLFLNNNDSAGAMSALNKPSLVGNMAKGAAKGAGTAAMNNYMNGGGKGMQKAPVAADAGTNGSEDGADNGEDQNVNVDNNDNIGIEQKDKAALPGSDDKKGKDGEVKEVSPGPTGGDGRNKSAGTTDSGSPNDMNPSMNGNNGKNSENNDKKIANKLKDANSLADIGTVDENGNFKPVNAMESGSNVGNTDDATNNSTRPVDTMNDKYDEHTTSSEKGNRSVEAAQNKPSYDEYNTSSEKGNRSVEAAQNKPTYDEYNTSSDSVDVSSSIKNVKSHSELNKEKTGSNKQPTYDEYNTSADSVDASGSHMKRKKSVDQNMKKNEKDFALKNSNSDSKE